MDLAYPKLGSSNTQTVNPPVKTQNPEYPLINSTESLEQIAIQKLGCDCPGCQAMASQMLLQGNLPQFQP
jgi:hypothetical protein